MTSAPERKADLQELIDRFTPLARQAVAEAGGPSPRRISAAQALGDRGLRGPAVASTIDHTLLKPGSTPRQVEELCAQALENRFAAVCINTGLLGIAVSALAGSSVKVACVVGFPLGATTAQVKAVETDQAVQAGAGEIDMVIDLSHLKAGDHRRVTDDILAVTRPAHEGGALVKLIVEAGLLTLEEKVLACLLGSHAGVDFVKTSTGFNAGGATLEDVALMRSLVGPTVGVKAAGGIRSLQDAEAMIAAGASRLGTSAGVAIMQEAIGKSPERPAAATAY
jgi:deoxyribose-phosphate aldolase